MKNNDIHVSRRKIGQIMRKYALVSKYTVKQFKVHRNKCNEDNIQNIVDQDFQSRDYLEVEVSDLTYVKNTNIRVDDTGTVPIETNYNTSLIIIIAASVIAGIAGGILIFINQNKAWLMTKKLMKKITLMNKRMLRMRK